MRLLLSSLLVLTLANLTRADVTLVANGQAQCVIVTDAATSAADKVPAPQAFAPAEAERQRQRLRESVKDLALYLGKMSGAKVEIVTAEPKADDKRVRVYVGAPAVAVFGAPTKTAAFKQGFRFVVSAKGVGLLGESDLASSYAVFELLDRLGCRWFMPSEMGEVVPALPTITLKDIDFNSAPGTIYRGIWYADEAYKRRNRLGGLLLSAGHALEMYVSKEDRDKHPDWRAEIGGKPHPHRLKWSSATLADGLADKLLAMHLKDPTPTYSLSPDDGVDWCESKDDKALDAGDFDPTHQQTAITDRLMVLTNRVATRVTVKNPDVLFGVLAYAQYTRPPVREKVHPSVVPQIAPITYSRGHPMNDDRVPGNRDLRNLIEGWAKKSKYTSMYYYAYNLAEPVAPQPFLAKWAVDVPFALKNNCQFWQPETMTTFETNMHALYMANRLAWNPALKPEDVYAEIDAKFYGAAAKEMTAYWQFVDAVWVNTPEYSGCGFGYLRRWTPERMAEARRLLNAGGAATKSPMEKKRVALADDSFKLFELFIKLRRDQADGHFATIAEEAATWRKRVVELSEQYKDQYCFTKVGWTPHTIGGSYFDQFYQQTYNDAGRVAKHFDILGKPLTQFTYQADPDKKGEAAGWHKPEFADTAWEKTDVCRETWSTLGRHDYFGALWYRTTIELPKVPEGRRIFLWLGSTDGSAKVFVNGQLVKHKGSDGKPTDDVTGFCQPFSFEITSIAKAGVNSIAILTTRKDFNELGTGGLLAPVMVYAEKRPDWVQSTAHAVPFHTAPEGEGYFSIIEGHNGKLYVGTHANGVNSWLVEFDPKTKAMKVVVDCHKAIGKDLKGFGSQAKIHTRNNVGASGKIYFGTKQGYPDEKKEKREDYPGGYPMVYDPKTGETKVYDIPVKHHGINSITPDEARGVAYISTCSDGRPGPGESSIFLVLDLKTGKYKELIDTKHIYGFIVIDHLGRAYHPLMGGEIARYDPKTGKLDRLKQTIDGNTPDIDKNLVQKPSGHPINWDISPDGKTLYSVPMSTNKLYAYDLTAAGDTLKGKDLGTLVPVAAAGETDCRAMCVGPGSKVWASVTRTSAWGISLHHIVSYTPGDKAPRDHGPVAIKNPDYAPFTDKNGKPTPFHHGVFKTPAGVTTSKFVTLGVCQTKAGGVYVLMLAPYTVLEIAPADLK